MIAILISTYNGDKYIDEQLDSIFAQTYTDFKVYIRDDGSTDKTVDVIEDYMKRNKLDEKMVLSKGKNIGFCASFFELMRAAEGYDYYAFCDQDDVWKPQKLEYAVEWMNANDHTKPILYHSGFEVGNEDLSIRKAYPREKFKYQFYNSITSNIFFGFSVVINETLRDMLLQAEHSNIKYHDWFAAMITAAFGKYHLSNKIEAIHRQYATNASPLYFFKKIPHGWKLLFGEHFYTKQAREFMRLYGDRISEEDRKVLSWFVMERYSFITACHKAFYRKRWNPQIKVEIILRLLMLIGVI
ncbi:MAG: glycosyltransferase [Lachnospiraceae bacterium]|nr:glycosyltransferase [Lachnospiraceae bacterium]